MSEERLVRFILQVRFLSTYPCTRCDIPGREKRVYDCSDGQKEEEEEAQRWWNSSYHGLTSYWTSPTISKLNLGETLYELMDVWLRHFMDSKVSAVFQSTSFPTMLSNHEIALRQACYLSFRPYYQHSDKYRHFWTLRITDWTWASAMEPILVVRDRCRRNELSKPRYVRLFTFPRYHIGIRA